MNVREYLESLNERPCDPAIAWAESYNDVQQAWDECERADWMLWYLNQVCPNNPDYILACCACARYALPNWYAVFPDDHRPEEAIIAKERFVRGEIGAASVKFARMEAWRALTTIPYSTPDPALVSASLAAWSAVRLDAPNCSAEHTGRSAEAVKSSDGETRLKVLKLLSDTVRNFVPVVPLKGGENG